MTFNPLNAIRPAIAITCSVRTPVPFDPKFLQMMVNRLMVGQLRHGNPTKDQNYLTRLKQAVKDYEATGNMESLIDAANYALLEAHCPEHPGTYYKALDSGGRTERYE